MKPEVLGDSYGLNTLSPHAPFRYGTAFNINSLYSQQNVRPSALFDSRKTGQSLILHNLDGGRTDDGFSS